MTSLESAHDFATTRARLDAELAARGLEVFARIDHAANAAAAGLAMPPALVVIFGNARAGTPLMVRAPALALDLPLRILIRADESGAVHVGYHDPAELVAPYGLTAEDAAPLHAVAVIAAAVAAPSPEPPAAESARSEPAGSQSASREPAAAESAVASAEPVRRVVVLDQDLPEPRTVGHVEVRRITMAPDVAAGPHVHNGPVFGHILTGSVTFQVGDEPPVVLRAGDVFHEPEAVRITRFDATADGVEFLGYFPLGPGEAAALTPVD
jgi:uncharacterized protein (DUF302 family)/quercetin dioxygenase-like cupin family protein